MARLLLTSSGQCALSRVHELIAEGLVDGVVLGHRLSEDVGPLIGRAAEMDRELAPRMAVLDEPLPQLEVAGASRRDVVAHAVPHAFVVDDQRRWKQELINAYCGEGVLTCK